MTPVIVAYCEGTDTKIAVLYKEKAGIKVDRIFSAHSMHGSPKSSLELKSIDDFRMDEIASDLSFDSVGSSRSGSSPDASDVAAIASRLADVSLSKAEFIPVVSEPILNYHTYDGPRDKDKNRLLDNIIKEINDSKHINLSRDLIDCVEINDKSLLSVFLESEVPCISLIDALASYNGKRYYKIPTIKSAEISLAYAVSKSTKFFPEDYSLIIYTGKEYSKLIFLEGQKLKHIGSTLDIGTQNLHTYDVYFSKILLEMENGNIPRLDNVILTGEDTSENLMLSFYGTFPEANVSVLQLENLINPGWLDENTRFALPSYAIPLATAIEYFDEQAGIHSGINILPHYIKEKQKVLQFGWASFILLPLIFIAAFFFTYKVLSNIKDLNELDSELNRLKALQEKNKEIIAQMEPLTIKIKSFDEIQTKLDSATVGTEVWGNLLDRTSDFIERRRNFWVTKIETLNETDVKISGYSLARSVLTEFAEFNDASMLNSVLYEPLREKNAFSFVMNMKLIPQKGEVSGP
ncbi:MAG: hypothetical protein V1720_00280 [bacterium]